MNLSEHTLDFTTNLTHLRVELYLNEIKFLRNCQTSFLLFEYLNIKKGMEPRIFDGV